MLTITAYSVELIKDPFGILAGTRYELLLDLEVPDDDELYSEQGVYVRAICSVTDGNIALVKYDLMERGTERYLDFDLEEDEVQQVETFCQEQLLADEEQ